MKKPLGCYLGLHCTFTDCISELLEFGEGENKFKMMFTKEIWTRCNDCDYEKRVL